MKLEPKVVLMVMDMQNDFCSREGVFARNGFSVAAIEKITPNIKRAMDAARVKRIPIIASKLTVLEDPDGKAMGLGHLLKLRPFLVQEGFRAGSWGHGLISEIGKVDYEVRKWGWSAIYQTDLEKILQSLGARTLVFTGVATNGVVEGTARDAGMRGYEIVTLTDSVAGYDEKLHNASLVNLANMGHLMSSSEFVSAISR